jgi:elongation factor 2
VEFQCLEHAIGGIYSALNKRRGQVFSEEERLGSNLWVVKAYIPVAESFGFTAALRSETKGNAVSQWAFDHWEPMIGSVFEKGGKLEELIRKIRIRKGLNVRL